MDYLTIEVKLIVKGATESEDKDLSFLVVPIATIFVRVSDGSWPDGYRAQLAAFATGIRRKGVDSVDHKRIILLDSGSGNVPVAGEGGIMLSRRVVSVETTGKLRVCVKAWEVSKSVKNAVKDELIFEPKEANRSFGLLDAGFCKMEVTVAWSLVSFLG
ncbi:hypothetical protein SETIT_2G377000v2 [Setaria italica]|uniref:DUF6598 domain-containing protein n=1 Tax=Setaria italica TaxID=4555 RepID=A0A368Q746_SETIT|nr:hypothetical protein SETIT_2G377000v2 [Setaria italica]